MTRLEVTFFMRRRDVVEKLGALGISEEEIDKGIKNKVLTGERFTGENARAYYRADMLAEKFGLQIEYAGAKCFIISAPTQAAQPLLTTAGNNGDGHRPPLQRQT